MSIFNSLLSGAAGLEIETGMWEPTSNTTRGTIDFTNTHGTPPSAFVVWDIGETALTTNSAAFEFCVDFEALFGEALSDICTSKAGVRFCGYQGGTLTDYMSYGASGGDSSVNTHYYRYHATETKIRPWISSTYYWRPNRTYKWIAIWT